MHATFLRQFVVTPSATKNYMGTNCRVKHESTLLYYIFSLFFPLYATLKSPLYLSAKSTYRQILFPNRAERTDLRRCRGARKLCIIMARSWHQKISLNGVQHVDLILGTKLWSCSNDVLSSNSITLTKFFNQISQILFHTKDVTDLQLNILHCWILEQIKRTGCNVLQFINSWNIIIRFVIKFINHEVMLF